MNTIEFVNHLSRTYDDAYIQNGAKVGNTVNARLPNRFVPADGQALQVQNLYDTSTPITLTNQKQVAFSWSSAEATTEIQDVRERYIQPAAAALANGADVLAYEAVYRDVYSAVGTPGVTPSSNLTYLNAGVKLTDLAGGSLGERIAVLDPLAMVSLVNANLTLFNPSAAISEQYRTGEFGRNALAINGWFQDPNAPVFTTGSFTSATPAINGANQTGSTLATNGWASGATNLKKGDIFTIAGVNSVNPISYKSNGRLQQFVVTADTSDSTGAIAALPISPSIITSGQLKTVDASPASGALITMIGSAGGTYAYTATNSPQSMLFYKDAFAFVMADLEKPNAGAKSTTVRDKDWGIAIRMVEQYNVQTDQNVTRFDILIGAATVQARLAARIFG